jgi:hypothetical protein
MLNSAIGNWSTVAGGELNVASGSFGGAAVGGGRFNIASGDHSTVPGGFSNLASAQFSFAAGQQAVATHTGAFVWADSTAGSFSSTANNQFSVRAGGGARFQTSGAGMSVDGNSVALRTGGNTFSGNQNFTGANAIITLDNTVDIYAKNTSGAVEGLLTGRWSDNATYFTYGSGGLFIRNNVSTPTMFVTSGGNVGIGTLSPTNKLHVAGGITCTALVQTSDRNAKENFAPVSPQEVLSKVAALPITTWNFKDMKDGRHMGPMAQDFYAAFGLGGSDATITSVDPDGVALAAIQGLNEKVEGEKKKAESEMQELKAANADLKQQLEEIKAALYNLAGGNKL